MINVVFTVFSLLILVVAVATKAEDMSGNSTNNVLSAETADATPDASASAEPTDSPTPIPATPTVTPTVSPTHSPTPTALPKPAVGLSLNDWRYTPSSTQSQTETQLILTSTESQKNITTWYKDKLQNFGFNVRSVIQTQSNEKVLNKLAGANGSVNVSVEIKQDTSTSPVTITVNLTGSNSSI